MSEKACAWCGSTGPLTWAWPGSRFGEASEPVYACEQHVEYLLELSSALKDFRVRSDDHAEE